jgi:hypothetical protein
MVAPCTRRSSAACRSLLRAASSCTNLCVRRYTTTHARRRPHRYLPRPPLPIKARDRPRRRTRGKVKLGGSIACRRGTRRQRQRSLRAGKLEGLAIASSRRPELERRPRSIYNSTNTSAKIHQVTPREPSNHHVKRMYMQTIFPGGKIGS